MVSIISCRSLATPMAMPGARPRHSRHVQALVKGPLEKGPTPLSEVLVNEIMVQPICFQESQTVKDAARIMVQHGISSGPVVDEAGDLVGVLTESDVLWKGAGVPMDHFIIPPVFIGAFDLYFYLKDDKAVAAEVQKILAKQVSEAMTKDTFCVLPGMSMEEASRIMLRHNIHSLPVVEGKRVVGMISRNDVLRTLISRHSPLLR